MLTCSDVLAELREHGALLDGHFVGTQEPGDEIPNVTSNRKGWGRHMEAYCNFRAVVTRPTLVRWFARGLEDIVTPLRFSVVAGLPMTAITLGSYVAELTGARFVMPYKQIDGDLRVSEPTYAQLLDNAYVLIVEDTVNDGETALKAINALRACGAKVAGVACVLLRGSATAQMLGTPLIPLASNPLPSFSRTECLAVGPCSRGSAISRHPGHGHDLEERINEGLIDGKPYADRGVKFVDHTA